MTTYQTYQAEVDALFRQRGWQYWSILSIGGRLMEEGGELAREVNHLYGDKKKRVDEPTGNIELEIGDIGYTLICLANSNGFTIGKSRVRTSGYDNDRDDPMSMLNRLGGHIGKLLHSLDEQHTRATIRSRTAIVMHMLRQLAKSMDLQLSVAIGKSIEKAICRDKNRFPGGK